MWLGTIRLHLVVLIAAVAEAAPVISEIETERSSEATPVVGAVVATTQPVSTFAASNSAGARDPDLVPKLHEM
ncbi:hypothetical protein C1H46_029537 [Malus baccata]|uniref:Uncharacterized protein n=1 Tax=Malus baccata TaxID=106549 RepID=A0A540LEP4_MALBA|nr:hypothetical protein C1H46_029537 [Malus baccata]